MLLQTSRVHTVPWKKALTAFVEIIENQIIGWWLTGSVALSVLGVDIDPGISIWLSMIQENRSWEIC
jgi:hypothetical protein